MKRLYSFLILSPVTAIAQANKPPAATASDTTGLTFFFMLYIFILLLLVIWLLRKSLLLKKTEAMDDHDARIWLRAHLNELDNKQLNSLINRGNTVKENIKNPSHRQPDIK